MGYRCTNKQNTENIFDLLFVQHLPSFTVFPICSSDISILLLHPVKPYCTDNIFFVFHVHVFNLLCKCIFALCFQYRAEAIVPQRMAEMEQAILKRDFQSFGKLTMQVRELMGLSFTASSSYKSL